MMLDQARDDWHL